MGEIKLPGFSYTFSWQIDACLSSLRSSKENSEIRANASLARVDCDCESASTEYGYPGIVSCDLRLLPKSENLTSGFVVDVKCADDLQRYEICFTYSIVNKEKECYVERSCPREAIRVRGCEARVEVEDFLNRNVLVKDLAVEPLDTIEILCEVSFLEKSAISTMKRPSEVSPTDDPDEQQQLTTTSSPSASTTSLSADLALLLNASRLSDVTLVTKDKHELKAHKAILGARSPVFASMFETDMLEQNENIVRIEDFEHEVLLETLRYIYAGTTEKLDELAGEILPVAEKYDIRPLKVDCEKLLEDRIDVDSCAKILVLADACNAEGLKAAAESFIIERGGEVMKANEELQSLRSSHPHLLGDILFKLLESKNPGD